jgi:hypothetical protein
LEASQFREENEAPIGASAELVASDFAGPVSSPWRLFWKRFREDRLALFSLGFIGLLVLIAILAPAIVSVLGAPDPNARDTAALDPLFATPTGPSGDHWFGIDQLGRDVFSRTIYGARVRASSTSSSRSPTCCSPPASRRPARSGRPAAAAPAASAA